MLIPSDFVINYFINGKPFDSKKLTCVSISPPDPGLGGTVSGPHNCVCHSNIVLIHVIIHVAIYVIDIKFLQYLSEKSDDKSKISTSFTRLVHFVKVRLTTEFKTPSNDELN